MRLRRRHCGAWNGWHRPWVLADTVAENTASVRILERLGFVRTARPPQGFLPGGADAGYLGLRPPLGWSGGDRLTGTAPCNMKK